MDRKEAWDAICAAEGLLEGKGNHPHFHIGQTTLTHAVRLYHDRDHKGARWHAMAILKMEWREDVPARAVAPQVLLFKGGTSS